MPPLPSAAAVAVSSPNTLRARAPGPDALAVAGPQAAGRGPRAADPLLSLRTPMERLAVPGCVTNGWRSVLSGAGLSGWAPEAGAGPWL